MSSYVNFFIRVNNQAVRIGSFSRNSEIYEITSKSAPYEQVGVVTHDLMHQWLNDIETKVIDWQKYILNIQNKIKMISSFNNSVDEKLEALHTYEESMKDSQETLDMLMIAQGILIAYFRLMENVQFQDKNFEMYYGIELSDTVVQEYINQ